MIARAESSALESASVQISGVLDPAAPVRDDVTVFNSVHLEFTLRGVTDEEANHLVERFKRR